MSLSAVNPMPTTAPTKLHCEIIRRVVKGDTDATIASGEHISERTVRRRIREVMDHFGVNSRTELAAEAVRRNLI